MKTDLEAMQEMAHRDMDIMAFPTISDVKAMKKTGKITFVIDPSIAQQIMQGVVYPGKSKYSAVLYVVNLEELSEIKGE